MKQVLTLAFLIRNNGGATLRKSEAMGEGRSSVIFDGEICLALKKRGFGEGNWNGYGGKIEGDETIEESAIREIKEESEVDVLKRDLEQVGIIEFLYPNNLHLVVHVFFVRRWSGEPQETEEMKPEWFRFDQIPYDHMWADDPHWLPRVLQGEKLIGKVWFNEDGKTIKEMEWNQVEQWS